MIPALDVANAFNQQNDKKNWKAVCTGELVHFSSTSGMVALVYDAADGTFAVKFNKFQGAFGDYVQAIRRGLFSVLNSLKSAGLPFEGPATVDDMEVVISARDADKVFASWPDVARPGAFHSDRFVETVHLNDTDDNAPLPPII